MKRPHPFFARWLALACVSLPAVLLGASSPPSPPSDTLLQQELKQQQIRGLTQRVSEQLDSIVTEFDRNDIAGEDVKVLRAIRSVLGQLSEHDMQRVIQLLQEARSLEAAGAATRRANDAYSGQKIIITQLHQLLLEYQRQQVLYEISLRLKELAKRQSDNMWLGVWLARKSEGRLPSAFDEGQQINWSFQKTEQDTIHNESHFILKKLENLAKAIEAGPTADRPKSALRQVKAGGLLPALDLAVDELKAGQLRNAAGSEKKVRDQLREIARLLILSPNTVDALKQALFELDRALDDQKKVWGDTQKVQKDNAAEVETKQTAVLDATDLVRKDVDSLAPIAAEFLKNATDKMQDARSTLGSGEEPQRKREKAPAKQAEAISKMEQARRALQEQLARVEQNSLKPENLVAALKDMQKEVRDLIQKEAKLKEQTAATEQINRNDLSAQAPSQGDLKDRAQELQAQAGSASAPQAAESLGEAASQMQKAQRSLAENKNHPAAQQAAIDALQKADQQLAQDIAKLEQSQQDLAQLETMQAKLETLIQSQQQVQLETARESLKQPPSPQASQALASQQDTLANHTGQLQQEAASSAPKAAEHLRSANEHMQAARSELTKPAPKAAQTKQGEALNQLYQAKSELDQKSNDLRDQLGLPPAENAQSLADAASIIAQALQDVNQARADMLQSQPGLLDSLAQQQKQIADALAQKSQDRSLPTKLARQAASQAAQKVAQADLSAAVNSMQQTQNALQNAIKSSPDEEPGEQKQKSGPPSQPSDPGLNRQPAPLVDVSPSLPELAQQQDRVQKMAETLLAAQKSVPAVALQNASQSLGKAAQDVGPLAAGELGPLPPSAESALQSAENSLIESAAAASANQSVPAQTGAAYAAQSLAQAQAALALAQAGLNSEAASQEKIPGQAQPQNRGKGQGQQKGQANGQGRGQGAPSRQGNGRQGNWTGTGDGEGPHGTAGGASQFTGLPQRDRAAIQQSQSEKYPQEYGPLVEQYLKNLSDTAGQKH